MHVSPAGISSAQQLVGVMKVTKYYWTCIIVTQQGSLSVIHDTYYSLHSFIKYDICCICHKKCYNKLCFIIMGLWMNTCISSSTALNFQLQKHLWMMVWFILFIGVYLWTITWLNGRIWTEINVLTSNLIWFGGRIWIETLCRPKILLYHER